MLTITDKKFIFNDNVSVCQLKVVFTNNFKFLNGSLDWQTIRRVQERFYRKYHNYVDYSGTFSQFRIRGIARCNESKDKFDEEVGAKIAMQRALYVLNKMENDLIEMYYNEVARILSKFDELKAKAELHLYQNEEYIKELIK